MELDQWLMVYLALTQTAAAKERTAWSSFFGGLIAEAILGIGLVFLVSVEPIPLRGFHLYLEFGLIAVAIVSTIAWLGSTTRIRSEATHLSRLLRGIEGQFAGAEFLRNLHRLSDGERVCVAASNWTCDEWLPSVSRLPLSARLAPRLFTGAVPLFFLLAWIGLLVRTLAL